MNLIELQEQIVAMIAKHGGDTIVVRQDSQSWIKDKDGKEIWEGDKVYCVLFYVVAGIVTYNEKKACFCVKDDESGEYVSFEEIINACTGEDPVDIFVLGNKFDKEKF